MTPQNRTKTRKTIDFDDIAGIVKRELLDDQSLPTAVKQQIIDRARHIAVRPLPRSNLSENSAGGHPRRRSGSRHQNRS